MTQQADVAIGTITDVYEEKHGEGTYGPWTMYAFKLDDGNRYTTFKDEIGEVLGVGVRLKFLYEVKENERDGRVYENRTATKLLGEPESEFEGTYTGDGNTLPAAPVTRSQDTYESPWKQQNGTWTQSVDWALRQAPFFFGGKVEGFTYRAWMKEINVLANEIYGLILKGPTDAAKPDQDDDSAEGRLPTKSQVSNAIKQTLDSGDPALMMQAGEIAEEINQTKPSPFTPALKGILKARGITAQQAKTQEAWLSKYQPEHPELSPQALADLIVNRITDAELEKA